MFYEGVIIMENKLLTLLENDATLTPEQLAKMLEKITLSYYNKYV